MDAVEDGREPGDRAALCTPETPTGRGSRGGPPPRTRSRVRLASLSDVAEELARVYRMVDRGDIESSEGTRRAYILASLGKAIEASIIEIRLSKLEELADEPTGAN